jgi:hypothetical protein
MAMSRLTNAPLVQAATTADGPLKPIGFALAAVVAGLAPGVGMEAPPAPIVRADTPVVPHDYAAEQDDSLLLGPSEAVDPFADPPAKPRQPDLFD